MRGAKLRAGHRRLAAACPTYRPKTLEGGFEGWKDAKLPLVPRDQNCRRATAQGRTVWVTRARPKIDRIACPWLIRRFVDPNAVFLFVAPSEVVAVGERFNAAPFDIENVFWSHRGELCTFDVMIEEFGLARRRCCGWPTMVRAADTGRLDLSPEAPGLAGGLARPVAHVRRRSRTARGRHAALYDAFYRWCRDATGETHNWPTNKAKP